MSTIYNTTTLKSEVSWLNQSNALFDPDIVTCTVVKPDGTSDLLTYGSSPTFPPMSIDHESLGLFRVTYDATESGLYTFIWYGQTAGGMKVTLVGSTRINSTDVGS